MTTEKAVYRNVRKLRYTQIGNDLLGDKEVTLQAKGLMAIFLSNSDDWTTHMSEIIKRSKNGRDAHYKIVDELMVHGYFARVEIRNEQNQFERIEYIFSDDKNEVIENLAPFKDMPNAYINLDKKKKKKTVDSTPITEKQETGNSEEKPFTENQYTVLEDTEKQNTENQYNNNTKGNNTNLNYPKDNKNNKEPITSISLSIEEELNNIDNNEFPIHIKQLLIKYKDRLIDDNINVYEIFSFYKSNYNTVSQYDFAVLLEKVLSKTKGTIGSFQAVMKTTIENRDRDYEQFLMDNPPVVVEEEVGQAVAYTSKFYNWLEERE